MGHYAEPNLFLEHAFEGEQDKETVYDLGYDPHTSQWTIRNVAQMLINGEASEKGIASLRIS